MSLQDIFYIVAIFGIVLFIAFLSVLIYLMLFIKTVIARTEARVVSKVAEYAKPAEMFKALSSGVLGLLIIGLRRRFGMR